MKAKSKAWIEQKYVEWRADKTGRKATITRFAADIGIAREVLNTYMLKGVKPEGENLEKVGLALGFEIYDIWGLARPAPIDKLVKRMMDEIGGLSDDDRDAIQATLDAAANRKSKVAPDTRVEQSRPKRKA